MGGAGVCPPPPLQGLTPSAWTSLQLAHPPVAPPLKNWLQGEGEKGLGVGHGQACGLPTPATVAPVPRSPSCWETEAAGCPCAEGHTRGRSPGGPGGVPPPAEEAPRAGPEALGDLDAPRWGAIDSLPYDRGEGVGYMPSVGPWSRSRSRVTWLCFTAACEAAAAALEASRAALACLPISMAA